LPFNKLNKLDKKRSNYITKQIVSSIIRK